MIWSPDWTDDALASLRLRRLTTLGERARTLGKPYVRNLGRVHVGPDFLLVSKPIMSHIVVADGALLVIGRDVTIEAGAGISCTMEIQIGDGVRIGRNVLILDSDYHGTDSRSSPGAAAPIFIGAGAQIGDGVVVLKGARVGEGARVAADSVVSRVVPDGAFASGVPARVRPPP